MDSPVQLFPIQNDPSQGMTERPLFPDEKSIYVPGNLEEVAAQAAIVESSHNGKPLDQQTKQSTYDIQTLGIDEVRRSIAEKEKVVATNAAEDLVRKADAPSLQDSFDYYKSVLDFHNPPRKTAMEEAVIETIVPKTSAEYYNRYNIKEATKNLASRNIMYNTLLGGESSSFWDKALVVGRSQIPYLNPGVTSAAVATALGKKSGWTDLVNPDSIIREFKSAYINASPEKRLELMQGLQHGLEQYSSMFGDKNPAQMSVTLNQILNSTTLDWREGVAWETLNVPIVWNGLSLMKGLITAASVGKPAVVAAKVGRADLSTSMMAKDAVEGSKGSGMDIATIAKNSTSLDTWSADIVEKNLDNLGVAQPMQERLLDYGKRLREDVVNTIRSSGETPEEISRAAGIVQDMYSNARNKAIHTFTPTTFENGLFKGEIKWQTPDGVPFQTKEAALAFGQVQNKVGEAIEVGVPAAKEITPLVGNTFNGTYRDGGKWGVTYRTVKLSDGTFALVRELTDDTGTTISHLTVDGEWAKGEPPKTRMQAGQGTTVANSAESFPTEEHALSMGRDDAQSMGASTATTKEPPKGITTSYKNYTEFLAAAKRAGSTKAEVGDLTGIKNAKDFNEAKWKEEFTALEQRVWAAEKTPDRPLTPEDHKIWRGGAGWKEFSRQRGYTGAEIADFQKHLDMFKEGAKRFGQDYVDGVSADIQFNRDKGFNPYTGQGGQWLFKENIQTPVPLSSIGEYPHSDVNGRNFFNMWIPYYKGSALDVNNRGVGLSAQGKIKKDLEATWKDAVKGLSGEEWVSVNKALEDGDAFSNARGEVGYVFRHDELAARGMSNRAIESYYQHRLIRDNMWLFRNKQMVEEFQAGGIKEMAFGGNDKAQPMVRPVKPLDKGSIKSLISQNKVGQMLDTRDGHIGPVYALEIDKIYENGGQVVRLYKPEGIGKYKITHIIIDNNETVLRDITTAIPYRPGEMARGYTDEYFVTLRRGGMLDEWNRPVPKEDMVTETLRTARNTKEAQGFVDSYNKGLKIVLEDNVKAANAAGKAAIEADKLRRLEPLVGRYIKPEDFVKYVTERKLTAEDVFDFHYNRDTHSYMQDTIDNALNNGRLFYSHRGEKLLATDPLRVNTMSVADSMATELANISRFITNKDVRVTAIERWMNTYGDGIDNRTFNMWMDFDKGELGAGKIKEALKEKGSPLADLPASELLKHAEASRNYIRQQLNIRTRDQKLNQERYRKSVEFIEGAIPKGLTNSMSWFGPWLRKLNVADFIRGINYNITLGMGNLSQLVVQANGMMISVGVHPIHGLPSAKTAVLLTRALMSDNPDVWKAMATMDSLTSLGLRNVNEFVDSVKAIRNSGILSDIRSVAMWDVEDGALDIYKGYAREMLSKGANAPFNMGETLSRLTSWEISRRVWKDVHPGADWTTDDALKAILIRQKEFNLGMQGHNVAPWQKGWLGIPLQFTQYNIKLATAFMHSESQFFKDVAARGVGKAIFNPSGGNYRGYNYVQAFQLLGTQLVLYGLAGNGVMQIADYLLGDKDTSMTEEQKMYASQGLAGGLIYSLTKMMDENAPAKLALGTRLGSFNWYQQFWDKIFTDKTNTMDFLFGVTKSTGVKFLDIIGGVYRAFTVPREFDPELVWEELKKSPEIIASWSNVLKGYMYMQNEGIVTSKFGDPIARINAKENLAAFLGFGSVQVAEYYANIQDANHLTKALGELAKEIKKIQMRRIDAILKDDQALADKLERLQNDMLQTIDPGHQDIVMKLLKTKEWPGDTAAEKLGDDFRNKLHNSLNHFRVMDKKE